MQLGPASRSKITTTALLAALAIAGLAGLTPMQPSAHHSHAVIDLPAGFAPEDIAVGRDHIFYVGSLATGAIYRGDLRRAEGEVLVPGTHPPAVGLFLDQRRPGGDRLWVAGGPTGTLRVYDATDGEALASYRLVAADAGGFVNDVLVTRRAAYVTDSFLQQLYVIPLPRAGGLPDPSAVRTVALTGDVAYTSTPSAFNLNGLAWSHGRVLSAQTNTGRLFAIDPETGVTSRIPVTDASGAAADLVGADGIVQRGSRLFIARNLPNQVAVVSLRRHGTEARLEADLSDSRLDTPSSVGLDGSDLYAVNARFTTPQAADTAYALIRLHAWND